MKALRHRPLLSLVLAFGLAADTFAVPAAKPKVIGVLFYADWCASCKVLDPKLDTVRPQFAGQPVVFMRVDATNDFTKEQSAGLAALLGVEAAYQENAGKTGFMLLIDTRTHAALAKFTKTQTEAELTAAIKQALGT